MLGCIEIVLIYLKKKFSLYQGKERPAKEKLVPAKLCAVLAYAESTQRSISQLRILTNFSKINIFLIDIHLF